MTAIRPTDGVGSPSTGLMPLVLRVASVQATSGDRASYASLDEDALPQIVAVDSQGCVVSRLTKLTEVKSETTDDT